jgi:hypothetical protein
MGLKVPRLDDVTFAQLVEEARKRIPQYAPEWTDYNLHDPGITIVELLAWLVEMQVFYLDQITEKHYGKFLKLLGEERKPTETIDEAIMRVQKNRNKPYRAVTLADFEYIAKETPGVKVARAKAVWNKDDGKVEVIVVPENGKTATEKFRKEVHWQLDEHRLLTTQIEVLCHETVRVSIQADIKINPHYSASDVRQRLDDMLEVFFDPLRGYDGFGWPFGRSVYASEVCARIFDVEGVDCVQSLILSAEGPGLIECNKEKVEIRRNALIDSGVHRIQIAGDQTSMQDRDAVI